VTSVNLTVLDAAGAPLAAAYVALADAVAWAEKQGFVKAGAQPFTGSVAAVSVGVVAGEPVLDLCYEEDAKADVDSNIVLTEGGGEMNNSRTVVCGDELGSNNAPTVGSGRGSQGVERTLVAPTNEI
jgi:ribonuclease PH